MIQCTVGNHRKVPEHKLAAAHEYHVQAIPSTIWQIACKQCSDTSCMNKNEKDKKKN